MGLFDRKDENLEKKELLDLKKSLEKTDKLGTDIKEVLLKKVNELLNNMLSAKQMDYSFEIEIIETYIKNYLENEGTKYTFEYVYYLKEILFSLNEKTDNYEELKEVFINKLLSSDGYLENEIFNLDFYTIFKNKKDYFDIMDIINNSYILIANINVVIKYAVNILNYCLSEEEFRNELLSYVLNFSNVVDKDYDSYSEECLKKLRKRHGEYEIDEKQIALLNSNVEKTETYMRNLSDYKKQLEKEKRQLKKLITDGKKDIKETSDSTIDAHIERINILKEDLERFINEEKEALKVIDREAIKRFNSMIEKEKESVIKKLDERFMDISEELKIKSDEVFSDILEQYKKQVEEFKVIFRTCSKSTTEDLLRIQKAAEESVTRLQEAVENEPQMQNFISKVKEENVLRKELIELVQKQEELGLIKQQVEVSPTNKVIIPGSERIVVPATPQIVIPTVEVNTDLIDAFNTKISFQKRMEAILKKKEKLEKNGQIYHEKIEEIIRCIIEGDWVYLWGPSGCGKSHLMNQLTDLLGIELVKNGKIGEPYTVMGYYDPQGNFRATQTYLALVYGKLLAYDEFDNGNADTQVAINEIYSKLLDTLEDSNKKTYVTFAEDVPALVNPNFRMISAGNTSGEGENPLYSSRCKIDESVQERMTPKFISYDNRVEKAIFGDYKEWYKFFCDFRKACDNYAKQNGQEAAPGTATTRDAASITKYINNNSKSLSQVISEKFVQTKNSEYREELGRFIAGIYKIDYANITSDSNPDKLRDADSKMIAKQFVYQCKNGAR